MVWNQHNRSKVLVFCISIWCHRTNNNFNKIDEDSVILKCFFDKRRLSTIYLTFSDKNEQFFKTLCQKVESCTNDEVRFNTVWTIRRIKSSFRIKEKFKHLSCITFEGSCSWAVITLVKNTRFCDHKKLNEISELPKYLIRNIEYEFSRTKLSRAPLKFFKEKNLGKLFFLFLNDQLNMTYCFCTWCKLVFVFKTIILLL